MSYYDELAQRVRDSVPAAMSHAELAGRLDITVDDLACLLGIGQDVASSSGAGFQRFRGRFASVELALLADILDVDVHWLITGNPDPYRIVHACQPHSAP
ncbi:hypothetical protein A5630_19445 [Mycolicibacterium mucogenicum]|uniref:XRE family transcriptional regulator n=1 Tax=Mycolicibacterium mucogenicum TaxID=56689 RepID=A0A1A3H4H7_MYCMU|nr:hypothetical protein [Mycolicibacterium mucogenicum]OBJ43187.1 hypothetical protein A5630_19445 [Mycolicibacterium mucogenicum]